jgi:sugar lactone lactonase YvrE
MKNQHLRKVFSKASAKLSHFLLALSMVVTGLAPVAVPVPASAAIASGMPAIGVMGQYDHTVTNRYAPSFTKNASQTGVNDFGFNLPYGMTYDAANRRLFVADRSNNRVLVFPMNANGTFASRRATYALGQPDLFSNAANRGGSAAANTLSGPIGVAYDGINRRLFVSDSNNNRVLVYGLSGGLTTGMDASYVLGQLDFATVTANRGGTPSAKTMNGPSFVLWDAGHERLLVSDSTNNRVLGFNLSLGLTADMGASLVLGQADFASVTANRTGAVNVNLNTLSNPISLSLDATGNRLFVADTLNNRVLAFNNASLTTGMDASNVLGQGDFTSRAANRSVTPYEGSMNNPQGVQWDAANQRLYVADTGNQRILSFSIPGSVTNGMNASHVLGQADFASVSANRGGTTASNSLNNPRFFYLDSANSLLMVSETSNQRLLSFDISSGLVDGMSAADVIGQYANESFPFTVSSPSFTQAGTNGGVNRVGFSSPGPSSFDTVGHRMFMVDRANNRVLVFNLNDDNTLQDYVADYVIGQPDFHSVTAGLTQKRMNSPSDVEYDPDYKRLFVSDRSNNRVLVWDLAAGIGTDMDASYVLGQPDFTTNSVSATRFKFNAAYGVGYDRENAILYVGEGSNNRVTVFDVRPAGSAPRSLCGYSTNGIETGMGAACVLGQDDFGLAVPDQQGAADIYGAQGIEWDAVDKRLFVADISNNRVLVYNLATPSALSSGMAASNVLGQSGFGLKVSAAGQAGMRRPIYIAWDGPNKRLFVNDVDNNRTLAYALGGGIVNGMNASQVIGQPDFDTTSAGVSQTKFSFGANTPGIGYEPTSQRLYVADFSNQRVMVFDASTTTGTVTSTLDGSLTLSRLAAGQSATGSLSYTLTHNVSTQLVVTFPAGFAVTGDATGAASSSCLSNFAHTATQITADKSNCAGPITLGGFTVSLPGAPGAYTVSWVNDDPGSATVYVVSGDTISVNATVDPSIAFDVGAASSCDGAFSSADWSVDLGRMSTGRTVASSGDASGAQLICTRLSTNATYGAVVTVHNANGPSGLVSASTPADRIPSAAAAVTSGTPNYGLCYSTVSGDSGYDAGLTPASTSPDASAGLLDVAACTSSVSSGAESVAALTVAPQEAWRVAGVASNAFAAMRVKAAISATQPAHNDYSDSLTFVATATF